MNISPWIPTKKSRRRGCDDGAQYLGDKDAAHIEFRLDNVQIEGVGVECETRASLHRVIQIPYYNIEFLIAIFQLHPACSHNVHLHIFKARN